MKIALVPHVYLPNIGGLENYVARLYRDLAIAGEDVHILTSDMCIRNKIPANTNGKVIYFRAFPSIFRNPFTLGLAFHLWSHEYDIIHVHSIHAFPTLISLIFKKKSKFIITAHGISPDNPNLIINNVWKLYLPLAKYLCKRSDKLIVLGNNEKEKMIKLLDVDPKKIEIIPNGIDKIDKPSPEIVGTFLSRFKLDGYKVILFTGRISSIKNPEILIHAFSLVYGNIKNIKLLMVGPINDTYKESLLILAERLNIINKVIFTGEVSHQELYSSYMIASCFVSLGAWEGLPTTMLEAMYFNVPCVVFNSGGIEDVILDGETGLLIDKLDEEIISNRILTLLTNNSLAERIVINAKNKLNEACLWKNCFEKIYSIYISQ